jgi:hypothetical protein
MRRFLGIISVAAGIGIYLAREFLQNLFWERVLQWTNPYVGYVVEYAPPLSLALLALWLLGGFDRLQKYLAQETPTNALKESTESPYLDIPDLRVADDSAALRLFDGPERDKLFPLLEAEHISAWARPMRVGQPPLTSLPGTTWKSRQLHFFPKGRNGQCNQTFIKTIARQETTHYDLYLNRAQIDRLWPQ